MNAVVACLVSPQLAVNTVKNKFSKGGAPGNHRKKERLENEDDDKDEQDERGDVRHDDKVPSDDDEWWNALNPDQHDDDDDENEEVRLQRGGKEPESQHHQNELNEEEGNESDNIEFNEPKLIQVPNMPTAAEWQEHILTHHPYKPWCSYCVRNKYHNAPRKRSTNVRSIPVFSLDYFYMTSNPDEDQMCKPLLVVKERKTKGVWVLAVDRKGAHNTHIIERIAKIINSWGTKGRN